MDRMSRVAGKQGCVRAAATARTWLAGEQQPPARSAETATTSRVAGPGQAIAPVPAVIDAWCGGNRCGPGAADGRWIFLVFGRGPLRTAERHGAYNVDLTRHQILERHKVCAVGGYERVHLVHGRGAQDRDVPVP
jgi:hypothetical protein